MDIFGCLLNGLFSSQHHYCNYTPLHMLTIDLLTSVPQDTLVLGSVGSNSWRGSLQIRHEQKDTQLEDPLMQMDSYMGNKHKAVSFFPDYLLLYFKNTRLSK